MSRFINRAQTKVDADVRLCANRLAILQKFIGAKTIAFQIVPGQVFAHRTLIFRPDAIFPVIPRSEIPTRPAQDGYIELFDHLHYVFAIAVFVGERTAFFINAAVNHPPQMLGKISKQQLINFANSAVSVYFDAGLGRLGKNKTVAEQTSSDDECE